MSDAHRVFLLECRLEQMRASVDEARAEASKARALLAEAAAREAGHAGRQQRLHEELAAAREEAGTLHHRLEHSEALRAGLEGRLFESTAPNDARELVRLRGEVAAHRDLTVARQRMVAELQARVEDLVTSRETLLSRVAEWQHQARNGDADAIDLAEFIAALSHDILALEHRSVSAEKREAELREQLLQASRQDDTDPSTTDAAASDATASDTAATPDAAATEPRAMDKAPAVQAVAKPAADERDPQARIETLLRLGRSGDAGASQAIRTELGAPEHGVRAAAYQALGQLLEHEPARLEPYLRRGIADTDPRVRRRVVLTAASARGLDLPLLLAHLRLDPDPQVRRVVKEVLRHAAPEANDAIDEEVHPQTRSGAA
jgi:hypothetical protein